MYFWNCVINKMPLWTRREDVPAIAKLTNIVTKTTWSSAIRCHRKGVLNVQRQSGKVDADGCRDRLGLTHRRTGLLADHVGKDLFHWLTDRGWDDPLITRIEKTIPEMKNQRGSERHQSDQMASLWVFLGHMRAHIESCQRVLR